MTSKRHTIQVFQLQRPNVEGISLSSARARLHALLTEIRENTDSHYSLYFDGFFIESLLPSEEESFRELAKNPTVELLTGFYFEPNLALCHNQHLLEHLNANLEFWKRMGRDSLASAWLPQSSLSCKQIELLLEHQVSKIFAHKDSFNTKEQTFLLEHQERSAKFFLRDEGELYQERPDAVPSLPLSEELLRTCSKTPPSEAPQLAEFRLEIAEELKVLPKYISEHALEYVNKERYTRAQLWFLRSQHYVQSNRHGEDAHPLALRQECYRALMHAQVEIDTIYHPESDPNDGWITAKPDVLAGSSLDAIRLHTPFARYHFIGGKNGGLQSLFYKPRKRSLQDVGDGSARSSFTTHICTPESVFSARGEQESTLSVPSKNPGVYFVRFDETLRHKGIPQTAHLIKDFCVKSGVGAHRTYATTGFSIDYWIEDATAEAFDAELHLALHCFYLPPSLSASLLQARALLPGGGEAEKIQSLENEILLSGTEPLSGLRLVDSLDQFIIDFRSSKPLSAIAARPLFSRHEKTEHFEGVELAFLTPLKDIVGSFDSASLFISIN